MRRFLKFFTMVCLFFSLLFNLPAAENSLIYLRSTEPIILDPGESRDIYSSEVIINIFEGLVRFKKGTYDIEPCLSEKWQVKENGKKWVFFIRKGVTFHNGETCDAHSVITTFQKRIDEKESAVKNLMLIFPYIKTIKALDTFTVEITLKKPYAPFLTALTHTSAMIIAPGSFARDGYKPIGTGPFEFEKWEKGKYLSIKRNEHYWGGPAPLPGVVFKTVANPAARTMQVKNGNADVVRITSAKEQEEFLGKKEVKIEATPALKVHYIAFNTRKFPFTKRDARRAMAHLINKRGLVKHVFQNLAIPAVTPIPPQLFGFNREITDYNFDILKTKKLLQQAGLGKGFSCRLYFSEKHIGQLQIANIITISAKRVNINIIKVPLPFKELVKRCAGNEHDMVILGWLSAPDPDFFLYPLFTLAKGNGNRSLYENPRLTNLLEKARGTLNRNKRIQYYKDAQVIIHRDAPWIPLYHLKSLAAHHKRIKNLYFSPNDMLIFRHTTKEE